MSTPATRTALARMRTANRRTVLAHLGEGPQSRASLARATGLSRSTVSSLVAELVGDGLVAETAERTPPHKGGTGRPPTLVALATPPGLLAGVDVGHRHVRVVLADRAATVRAERTVAVDVDGQGALALDAAADLVERVLRDTHSPRSALLGVGMCVPAPIDRRTATVTSRILRGWHQLAPAPALEERLGVPVAADNDANLGALAELRHGAARGLSDVVYVKVSSGLGAGLVLGGRLHRGATGIAGEIGHVQLREDGAVCRCGNRGCLETEVTVPPLLRILRPAYDEELDVERVLALEAGGDAGVCRVLADAGRTIGRALADLCNSLNPEAVVVGGALGPSPALRDGVRAALDRYAQPDTAAAVTVLAGQVGERAEAVGALALARSVVPEA